MLSVELLNIQMKARQGRVRKQSRIFPTNNITFKLSLKAKKEHTKTENKEG